MQARLFATHVSRLVGLCIRPVSFVGSIVHASLERRRSERTLYSGPDCPLGAVVQRGTRRTNLESDNFARAGRFLPQIRKEARRARISVWGRLGWPTAPLTPIPPEFWEDNQISLRCLTEGYASTEWVHVGRAAGAKYHDLTFNIDQVFSMW